MAGRCVWIGGRGVCTRTYLGPNRRGGGDTTMENFGAKLRAKLEKLRANRERGKYLLANDRERLPEEVEHGVVPGESAGIGRYTPPTRQEERERMQDKTYEVRRKKKKKTRKERGRTEEEAEKKKRHGTEAFRNQTC